MTMEKENRKMLIPEFGPFAGLRVVSAGSLVAMPHAGAMLADFGAEVIHIERPGVGDTLRSLAPFSRQSKEPLSNAWAQEGRNRLSMTLDLNLNKPGVKEIFFSLIKDSDIFMENLVWLDKLGISDDELLEMNPRLVIAHVSGYGRPEFGGDPEICNRASYDMIGQAFSGYMFLNGDPDAPTPTLTKPWMNDYVSGLHCVFGVLAAYLNVLKTGKGQVVDVAQFEACGRIMCDSFVTYTENQKITHRSGTKSRAFQPYGIFFDKNKESVAIGAFGPAVLKRFVQAVGWDPEYFNYRDVSSGPEAIDSEKGRELDRKIGEWCSERTVDEIVTHLSKYKVPCSKVNNAEDCYNNKHFHDRGDFITYTDETKGEDVTTFGFCPKFSDTPGRVWRGAPRLGQDTETILRELVGFDETQIQNCKDTKII